MPDTGGANIPALNDLLSPWGVAFGDRVFEGDFIIGGHNMYYASGTVLNRFPNEGVKVWRSLKDQGINNIKNSVIHSILIDCNLFFN